MAEKLTYELVSPERMLASEEAESVTLPGAMGDLTAMANHAPFLTTLRPGYVAIDGGQRARYFVTGGFAEINDNTVSILAEEAVPEDEATPEYFKVRIEQVEKMLEEAGDERRQIVDQQLRDMRAAAGLG